MKTTTLVKFMTKEELVEFLIQVEGFKYSRGETVYCGLKKVSCRKIDQWYKAKEKFDWNKLCFAEALDKEEGGYVWYIDNSYHVLNMLKVKFGFEEE